MKAIIQKKVKKNFFLTLDGAPKETIDSIEIRFFGILIYSLY